MSVGGLISYNEISKNINLSFQSIKKYLCALEKSNLMFAAIPFFRNKLKEITKQPKIYFVDSGMKNYTSKKFDSEIDGALFENYVLDELIKTNLIPKYWRSKSGSEVDFVIEKEGILPIEVKLTNPEKIGRGLLSFIKEYKPRKALVIFYKGEEKTIKEENCEIIFTNIINLSKHLTNK